MKAHTTTATMLFAAAWVVACNGRVLPGSPSDALEAGGEEAGATVSDDGGGSPNEPVISGSSSGGPSQPPVSSSSGGSSGSSTGAVFVPNPPPCDPSIPDASDVGCATFVCIYITYFMSCVGSCTAAFCHGAQMGTPLAAYTWLQTQVGGDGGTLGGPGSCLSWIDPRGNMPLAPGEPYDPQAAADIRAWVEAGAPYY